MYKALLTGGSRGIGKVIKDVLITRGVEVSAPSRQELNLCSNESICHYCSKYKSFDILINCAGINELASIEEIDEDCLQRMLQVNLTAQAMLIKYTSENMKKNKYGRIVNFASIWCQFTKTRRVMYSAAKAGVCGLTRGVAVELAEYNVLVNAIAPGFVATEMTYQNNTSEQIKAIENNLPIKRMAQPSEIAELVYFLISPQNTYITGQTIFIDGGFSCV